MDRFWKYKLEHVIFWIATVGFHTFTRLSLIDKAGFDQFLMEIAVRNGLLAIMIYYNLLVLIPKYAQRKKVLAYAFSLLVTLTLYVLLKNVHDVYLNGYRLGDASQRQFFHNTYYNLSIAMFYLAFSVALHLSKEWYFQLALIRRMEVEKLNAELEYLKAQINPHFLFNSINTIYFQIDRRNAAARESLSAFSDMLRYQLYECNGNEIPIEKEIKYLKNYVNLQRIRRDENYNILFLEGDDLKGFTISPFLLIPFVENAFKHVSHNPARNEVRIRMSRRKNNFRFNVFNTKEEKIRAAHAGIGLKNVKRRLELLYRDRHELIIDEKPDSFEVSLALHIGDN